MIGRILRIFFFMALLFFIANRLFSRQQKRSLNEVVQISAWVCLIASALALIVYAFFAD